MSSSLQVIMLLSGGLDSTVLSAHYLAGGHRVRALSIDYGQRHRRELAAAAAVAGFYQIEHRVARLGEMEFLFTGSSLTDPAVEVPEGPYTTDSMKVTVVPNRNMILLSLAIAWAVSTRSDIVACAAHAGDHVLYPDCRPEFISAIGQAARLCDWHAVRLETPFLSWKKDQIVHYGQQLAAPFHLTWSCYQGKERPCGRCGTCVERRQAFQAAGVDDPLLDPGQDQ